MDDPIFDGPEPALPVPPALSAPPVTPVHDAPAVALGNASLLGIGYLMLGRRRLAAAAVTITVVLVAVRVDVARLWCDVLLLSWWAVVVAHGWFLAGGRARPGGTYRQRTVALAFLAVIAVTVGLLRLDAHRIERGVTGARESGDCAGVFAAQDRVWLGHRIADAPLAARGDEEVEVCRRLEAAGADLLVGLTADPVHLDKGFDTLASVLKEPGNRQTVESVLDDFFDGLPTGRHCETAEITDWLRQRRPSHDVLKRTDVVVTRVAPAAVLGCADDLMDAEQWEGARKRYRQFVDQYRADERATEAAEGVEQATQRIELAHVRELLNEWDGTQPAYCSTPAKYSGADAYGKGTNPALFRGDDTYTGKLPGSWRAEDVTDAVLVVCAGEAKQGTGVRTCPYESATSPTFLTEVTFHRIAVPVKVYELRTGELVADRKVEISGTSCPEWLEYTTYGGVDTGPPSDVYVDESKGDVRDAFRPLIMR